MSLHGDVGVAVQMHLLPVLSWKAVVWLHERRGGPKPAGVTGSPVLTQGLTGRGAVCREEVRR